MSRSSIRFQFNPEKSTQAAAYFLEKGGGSMSKYVLLKLLYLADRNALERWNQPITGDEPVSMQFGPVPSHIYDLTKGGVRHAEVWGAVVKTAGKDTVVLTSNPGRDDLSDSELSLLDDIWSKFGGFDFGRMKDYCHALPEYDKTVGKGSRPISIESVLTHLGKTPEEIQQIASDAREEAFLRNLVGA